MPSKRKQDEIDLRLGLGDDIIVMLWNIDDRTTAEQSTGYIWEGIDD